MTRNKHKSPISLIIKVIPTLTCLLISIFLQASGTANKIKEAEQLMDSHSDSALVLLSQIYQQAKESTSYLEKAIAAEALARAEVKVDRHDDAIGHFKEALTCYKEADSAQNEPEILKEIATSYYWIGKYDRAIQIFYEAIEQAKKFNNNRIIANCNQNMGLVYTDMKNYPLALKCYNKALAFYSGKNEYLSNTAAILQNTGIIYSNHPQPDSAIQYYLRSLSIYEQLDETNNIAIINNNLGVLFEKEQKYDSAIRYYQKALDVFCKVGFKRGISVSLFNIGVVYTYSKNYLKSLRYLEKSLDMSRKIGFNEQTQSVYLELSYVYEMMGNYMESLDYLNLAYNLRDSLYTTELAKQSADLEVKYETRQKEQQLLLQKTELQNKNTWIKAMYIILALVLGILVLTYFLLWNNKKLNKRLSERNRQLFHRNEQITNSITYASLIQQAILPPPDLLQKHFPEHFLIFKPKDIVSGDFYWMAPKEDGMVLSLADCTGHGVPGAFMSLLGMTFLNEIVNINNIEKPDIVMGLLQEKTIKSLHQGRNNNKNRDGMEIAFCNIDLKTQRLLYSGSYLPLYVLRKGEIMKLEATKIPIGYHGTPKGDFHLREIELETNDILYLYSDGIIEQFNEKNKKFTRDQLHSLLKHNASAPLSQQREILLTELEKWQGTAEQLDDISMIGIKIPPP